MEIFNGVFNGDDVGLALGIDFINNAGKAGALATARRAGDQHHTVAKVGKLHDLGRDMHGGGIRQGEIDNAADGCNRAALLVGIAAETADIFDGKGKVIIAVLDEMVKVTIGKVIDAVDQFFNFGGHQFTLRQGLHGVIDLYHDPGAGNDENVRTAERNSFAKKLYQSHESSPVSEVRL